MGQEYDLRPDHRPAAKNDNTENNLQSDNQSILFIFKRLPIVNETKLSIL